MIISELDPSGPVITDPDYDPDRQKVLDPDGYGSATLSEMLFFNFFFFFVGTSRPSHPTACA